MMVTCVRIQMFPQMGALLETLSAHGARVPAVPAMNSQYVGLDVAIAGEELETDSTSMLIADLA